MQKYFLIVCTFGLLFSACTKGFLDEVPDNRAELNSITKLKQLLNGAYGFADYVSFTEPMSDNADDKGTGVMGDDSKVNDDAWAWKEYFTIGKSGGTTEYWAYAYKTISTANHALRYINENLKDSTTLNPYKGEALLLRAYAHFMLVNLFAKHYNIETASSDMGVPYVKEVETQLLKQYKRNSVQEVYDYVEQDMLEGIRLIKDEIYDVPSFHFTKKAAYALATRFYLFKGNQWDKVLSYANLVLNDISILADRTSSFELSYSDQTILYNSPELKSNLLICDIISTWNRFRSFGRYGFTTNLSKGFFDVFSKNTANTASLRMGLFGSDLYYTLPKYKEYFEYQDIQAGIGYPHLNFTLLTAEEVLFSRAEAYVMLNQLDNALNDVNIYYSKTIYEFKDADKATYDNIKTFYEEKATSFPESRIFNPYYDLPSAQNAQNLLKIILDLKRLNFLQEGLRWFDIRRMHISVVHTNVNGTKNTLLPKDKRYVLQIPEEASTQGITKNER